MKHEVHEEYRRLPDRRKYSPCTFAFYVLDNGDIYPNRRKVKRRVEDNNEKRN